jgi:hypothetical protein
MCFVFILDSNDRMGHTYLQEIHNHRIWLPKKDEYPTQAASLQWGNLKVLMVGWARVTVLYKMISLHY